MSLRGPCNMSENCCTSRNPNDLEITSCRGIRAIGFLLRNGTSEFVLTKWKAWGHQQRHTPFLLTQSTTIADNLWPEDQFWSTACLCVLLERCYVHSWMFCLWLLLPR